ncbi:antitoxin [Candidatus Woesearchaeota archaeon]|nr:antitoxin [Candidatus Woesearchaeota archaeon]|tara:strand:- start:2254 stop:2496 length:243 start_codon:yes stop_codon:yes gene_type:complete
MVQAIIKITDKANRVLNIVKAKYGLKDKSEAINVMAEQYENDLMEPELRPEYIEKLQKIKKQKGKSFGSVVELRKNNSNK